MKAIFAALLAVFAAGSAIAEQLSTFDNWQLRERYARLLNGTAAAGGEYLYQAQALGTPLVIAAFRSGDDVTRAAVLHASAQSIANLPRISDLAKPSIAGSVRGTLSRIGGPVGWAANRAIPLDQRFDNLPLPVDSPAARRRMFPMKTNGAIDIKTGNAQQFAYLLSTVLRLAAASPPKTRSAQYDRDMRDLYAFLMDDTLRLYWLEAPAWHWQGPYPNMRARTLARLNGEPKLASIKWFRAFTDYDLHVLAIAADLATTQRHAAWLVRGPADRALTGDALNMGWRVLHERIDSGANGTEFAFDRGYWDANPSVAYAACLPDEEPKAPCPPKGYTQDISHAQRWPLWLSSFGAALAGRPAASQIAAWRRNLAHQIASKVLRTDSGGRPLMSNFVDGRDGWYLYSADQTPHTGYPPHSLTGWAMRHGNWALLQDADPRLGRAYQAFCRVALSDKADDIAFRTRFYGAPGAAASGFRSNSDEFGPDSAYGYICRVYAHAGII